MIAGYIVAGERSLRRGFSLSAAAALVVAGRVRRLEEGATLARWSIDSGSAAARLEALVRATNEGRAS